MHRTGFNSHWDADLRARNIEFLSAPTGQTLHAAYDDGEMVGTAMSFPLTVFALVLGGQGATVLSQAGQVTGDAERADALLGWSHAPWSPLQF